MEQKQVNYKISLAYNESLKTFFCSPAPQVFYSEDMDTEVINEIDKVRSINSQQASEYGIVFKYLSNAGSSKKDKFSLLSLTVAKSSCVGLICQNSNIRSLIFKMITGEKRINAGEIFISGKSINYDWGAAYKTLGYCSKDCTVFKHMTGRENLKILGLIKGVPKTDLEVKIKNLSEELGIEEYMDKRVKGYSEMNRKILGIMIALISDPQVIVLEEPTNELDEITTQKVLKLLNKLKNDGKTILILSNNLLPYESICSKIAVVAEGFMKFVDSPENFINKYSKGLNLIVELKEQKSKNEKLSIIVEIKSFVQRSFIDSKLRLVV